MIMYCRHWVFITLMVLALLWGAPPAYAAPTVTLDGRALSFEVPPIIEEGRTLVPLRAIFEAMGAVVTWEPFSDTAIAVKDYTTVIIPIGSTTPTINGQVKYLDVPAKLVEGRTLAPLRFVAEAFGGTVLWNAESESIAIQSAAFNMPPGSIQANPVPLGQTYLTGQGWGIRVDGIISGSAAWKVIEEASSLNAPPAADMQYIIITCTINNQATQQAPAAIDDSDFELIGPANLAVLPFDKTVTLPDEAPLRALRAVLYYGEHTTGSMVFYVPAAASDRVLLWHHYSGESVYFALQP
jgi:hypothetical protein